MAQRTGKAYIYVNGVLQETMKGSKLEGLGGITRDVVKGSQIYGYAEEAVEVTLSCSFAHGPGISAEAINAITDAVILYETDSGVLFTLLDCFNSKPPSLDVDGHKLDCEFKAVVATETGAGDSTVP
jgi:hypothetical protein